jgi:hypothetical protein
MTVTVIGTLRQAAALLIDYGFHSAYLFAQLALNEMPCLAPLCQASLAALKEVYARMLRGEIPNHPKQAIMASLIEQHRLRRTQVSLVRIPS